MAEVIDSQGVMLDLSGVDAANVKDFTGSEGRAKEDFTDFSAFAELAKGALKGISGVAHQIETKRKKDKIADTVADFQDTETELVTDFLAGEDTSALVKDAFGIGGGISAKQLASMKDYQEALKRIDKTRGSGKSDLALAMLKAQHRQRFVMKHPDLASEAASIFADVESIYGDITVERQKLQQKQENMEDRRRAVMEQQLLAEGYNVYELSPKEQMEALNAILDNRKAALAQERALAEAVEEGPSVAAQLVADGGAGEVEHFVFTSVIAAVENIQQTVPDRDRQMFLVQQSIQDLVTDTMRRFNLTPDGMKYIFGDVRNYITNAAESVITGDYSAKAARNAEDVYMQLLRKELPKAYRAGVVLGMFPNPIADIAAQNNDLTAFFADVMPSVLKLPEDADEPPPRGDLAANKSEIEDHFRSAEDSPANSPVPAPDGLLADTSVVKPLNAKKYKWKTFNIGQTVATYRSASSSYAEGDKYKGTRRMSGVSLATVLATSGATPELSMLPVKRILDLTADPVFVKELDGVQLSGQEMKGMQRLWVSSRNALVELAADPENEFTISLTEQGLVSLQPSEGVDDELAALEELINNSIKTTAHLNRSTDYRIATKKYIELLTRKVNSL